MTLSISHTEQRQLCRDVKGMVLDLVGLGSSLFITELKHDLSEVYQLPGVYHSICKSGMLAEVG